MGSEWSKRKIGSLGRVVTGKTPSTMDPNNFGGPYPFITIPDMDSSRVFIHQTERTLSEQAAKSMHSCLLPRGAVMMSCIATIGKCGITTKPSFTNQQINSVICNADIDPQFLFYCFRQLGNALDAAGGGGSVYTNVSKSRFSDIEVQIPQDYEQRAITHILGTIDDKIELNRQMNRTLEAISRAIFEKWFVEEVIAHKCKVSDVVEFDQRISITKGATLPYVDMKGLSEGSMAISNVIQKAFSGGSKFQNGDTLLARITPCLENGKTGFVDFLQDKDVAFGSTEFIVMRPKIGISPQFVYCLARNPNFRECAIQSMVGSSGRQRVQADVLANYEISKPQDSVMTKFEKITKPLFQRFKKNREETIMLSEIRDTLLPQLMSGKIRVRVSEKEAVAK